MKLRWILFLLIGMGLSLCSPSVHAQGFPIENVVWNQNGFPVSGASITVCAGQYTGTPPCTSPATIYSDLALTQPIPNPITTGSLGDYRFVVAAGVYTVSITASGAGLTPTNHIIVVPFGSGSDAAIKPAASDAVQYIGASGITGQDGLSRGSSLPATLAGISSAQTNLPANGGTIVVQGSSQISLATQLSLGTATQHVTLLMERGSSITWTGTGCAISVASGSAIIGPNLIGANVSNVGGASIFLGASATGPLICNAATDGTQEYFNASGLILIGNGLTNQSAPLIKLTSVFVNSYLRDIVVYNYGGPLLQLQNGTVGAAGFGPFICDNCWLNGSTLAGAQPVVITAQSGGGLMGPISFIGGAVEHAGIGLNEVTVDGSANHTVLGPVSFHDTYCENSFAASSCWSFKDVYGSLVEGGICGGIAGTDCVSYSGDASQQAGFGSIVNLYNSSAFTNTINDKVRPVVVLGANINRIGHYVFSDPNATNQQALNVPAVILVSSGGGTILHQAPNTASNFIITDPAFATTLTGTVASGTATMTTGAIGSGACGTTVTVSATGTLTTDTITYAFNAAVAANPGELTLRFWPTTGNVNFEYCNPTAGSITPTAATLNWRVVR